MNKKILLWIVILTFLLWWILTFFILKWNNIIDKKQPIPDTIVINENKNNSKENKELPIIEQKEVDIETIDITMPKDIDKIELENLLNENDKELLNLLNSFE